MLTELRRHREGAVTTVETGMMFGLRSKAAEVAPMLPDAVDTLGYGYSWRAIELPPGLAGPALVAHMRHRASISIMARKGGGVAYDAALAGDLSWLIDDPDRTIADPGLARS